MTEPDNIVLELLRSMRSDLTDVKATLTRVEHRLDEVNEGMVTALGLSGHAHIRQDNMQKQIDELTARVARLEEKV